MSNTVLKVENLSKEYRLGTIGYGTLREDLQSWWARLRGKDDPNSPVNSVGRTKGGHFMALDDINFEVKQGERLGIIGKNGAGKSTLLKLLSRITAPSKGSFSVKGRIGSLLEVGTGFHPELTGRENVYLNGSILGMKKKEIDKKFDEIVDFSGVEKFIDTPVKRYSSGMFVRLGFAVAAHLEPEILIVDEVLAVGDAEFQKKAIGKMEDVSTNDGRTILFVSHNMASVRKLCNRGILLEGGKIVDDGEVEEVIEGYVRHTLHKSKEPLSQQKNRKGNGDARFIDFHFEDKNGFKIPTIIVGEDVFIVLEIETYKVNIKDVEVSLSISNGIDKRIAMLYNRLTGDIIDFNRRGKYIVRIKLNRVALTSGMYYFNLFLRSEGVIIDWIIEGGFLEINSGDYFKTGNLTNEVETSFLIDHSFDSKFIK